ncbi:MAG: class I SAM-dependent methyltransferase [Planctomycetota bacterium]|nr:class I SAM-dependent methyltransferase [Planctomycetota bacterium]
MTSPNQPAGPGSAGFFDKLGDHYDEAIARCVPRYHEMLDQMLDYLDPRIERPAILELGCGSGNLTEKLVRKYPDSAVQAVDASSRMIEIAGQRFQHFDRVVFLQQAFQELQLPADSLDLVVSSIAIHHLQDSEKQELFLRIREWLRPGVC